MTVACFPLTFEAPFPHLASEYSANVGTIVEINQPEMDTPLSPSGSSTSSKILSPLFSMSLMFVKSIVCWMGGRVSQTRCLWLWIIGVNFMMLFKRHAVF